MKLENQIVNLELSKKLKELKVKQESIFYHMENTALPSDNKIMYFRETKSYQIRKDKAIISAGVIKYISAFTVAELGEMLPAGHIDTARIYFESPYRIEYKVNWKKGNDFYNTFDKSEANARAKMLIYLLENKLL